MSITQTTWPTADQNAGTGNSSYFPDMRDVTQYATGTNGANGTNGPGDVYIQGVNSTALSVLSDGDAVVTGNLTNTGSGATLVNSLGDIRIYNPMSCANTGSEPTSQLNAEITSTTAGFCPNDLTGLYTGGLVSGSTLSRLIRPSSTRTC